MSTLSTHDELRLERMRVRCVVGIYPGERERPQPLELSLSLFIDKHTQGQGLKSSVDYARLWGELKFLLEHCRFRTLEAAAEALARYVLVAPSADLQRAQVHAVTVALTKPEALGGEAIPTLKIQRLARDYQYTVETKPFGHVDVIYESDREGIYRLRLLPGRSIQAHVHHVMEEHELVLGSELLLQGRPVRRGMAFTWPKAFAHRYDNPSGIEQSVLCVDCPAFIPADEIEVPLSGPLELPHGRPYYPVGDSKVGE